MQQRSSRGVQQHDVDAAADALLAQRLRPTVERVRQHMGRGSPNTVGPMLEVWFGTLAPRLGIVVEGDDTGSGKRMPAPVRQAIESVWAAALASAHDQATTAISSERERLGREREELGAARAALASQEAAVAQREQLLREARDLAQRQLAEVTQQLGEAQASLQDLRRELAELRDSLATLVQQKDGAAREHQQQLAAAAQERERLQEQFAASERRLLNDVDRAREEAKATSKAFAEAEHRHAARREDFERSKLALDGQVHQLQIENAALRERLAASERRASEYQDLLAAAAQTSLRTQPRSRKRKIAGS